MDSITFFTPVTFGSNSKSFCQSALEKADQYFYLGGKQAHTLKNDSKQIILIEGKTLPTWRKVVIIFSYFLLLPPLLALSLKVTLRYIYKFKVIEPKTELEKGISVSDQTKQKIESLTTKIFKQENDPGIEWVSKGNSHVFKMPCSPGLVFKISKGSDKRNIRRFTNMIKAKRVCLIHGLSLLVIPNAVKFALKVEGKTHTFIAEKELDFAKRTSAQEELYRTCSDQLKRTTEQLTEFIINTGLNDITWRNVPILNETGKASERRIGLIDLEHMNKAVDGFEGDVYLGRGLIGCLFSESLIDQTISRAKKRGVKIDPACKKNQMAYIKDDQNYREFLKKKNISTGKEPLVVDPNALELDVENTFDLQVKEPDGAPLRVKRFKMRDVITNLVSGINTMLANRDNNFSIKGKRALLLNIDSVPNFKDHEDLGLETDTDSWIGCIINALVAKGHLYKLDKKDDSGYLIRA